VVRNGLMSTRRTNGTSNHLPSALPSPSTACRRATVASVTTATTAAVLRAGRRTWIDFRTGEAASSDLAQREVLYARHAFALRHDEDLEREVLSPTAKMRAYLRARAGAA
jgi:hypothetical protein